MKQQNFCDASGQTCYPYPILLHIVEVLTLLTKDMSFLIIKAFSNIGKTGRAED